MSWRAILDRIFPARAAKAKAEEVARWNEAIEQKRLARLELRKGKRKAHNGHNQGK